jgi:TonB-dependent starch-binding outer membrane protein SusC
MKNIEKRKELLNIPTFLKICLTINLVIFLICGFGLTNSMAEKSYSQNTETEILNQQTTVSGKVTDLSGQPLPGVTIVIKNTTQGTVTDVNGEYTLTNVPANATLVFSFVGMRTQEVIPGNQTIINVNMEEETIGLEEVVAIGYGTREKGRLTGSVSNVQTEEVIEAPVANVVRSIQGKLPGLVVSDRGGEPGDEDMQILIRGKSTLGNNSPLVVIDGVPRDGFGHLNALDIENISVLKDASAAIYGAQAANGVILITTRKGKEGVAEIVVNSNYTMSTFFRHPQLMDAYQFTKYFNEVDERYGRNPTYTEEDLELYKNGTSPLTHPNTDWYKEAYRNFAPRVEHTLSATGGTDKIKYYLSGGYMNEESLFISGDQYHKKYTITSNIDAQVHKYLNIGFKLMAQLRDNHMSEAGPYTYIHISKPNTVARYPNGLPGIAMGITNPIVMATDEAGWHEDMHKLFRPILSFDFNMDWVTKGLSLNGYGSFEYYDLNTSIVRKPVPLYDYNEATGEYDMFMGQPRENQTFTDMEKENDIRNEHLYHIRLNYKRNFDDHNFEGFVAYEQMEGYSERMWAYRKNLVSPDKPELFAAGTDQMNNDGSSSEWGRVNYFGYVGYDYKRKYLIDFTLRHDGSFNFPENKRFGTFPGASVGWTISEEPFMLFTDNWLSNLKLRASWATMGNDRVPQFQYLTKYSISVPYTFYIFGETPTYNQGFQASNVPNPNITWEKSKMWNFGFDAVLWRDKLTATFDYFYEQRREILITRAASIPSYTALTLPDENLGEVDNRGFELQLVHNNNLGEFQYSIGGNFQYNKNKIIYMDESPNIPEYQKREGYPIDSYLLYKTDGIFNTMDEVNATEARLPGTLPGDIKYVDLNGDGEITADDRYRKYSSPTPRIQFGLTTDFNYKNFNFNLFFQGQTLTEAPFAHTAGIKHNLPEYLFTKRWTEDNPDATYPRAYDSGDLYQAKSNADFWYYDASFIKLKHATLAYNIPSEILSKISIQGVQLYVKGYNLFALDRIKQRTGGNYYDPELSYDATTSRTYSAGVYYHQNKSYTFGMRITL